MPIWYTMVYHLPVNQLKESQNKIISPKMEPLGKVSNTALRKLILLIFLLNQGATPPPPPLRKVSHFEAGISPTRTKNCIFALSKVNINGTNTSKNGSKSLKIVFLYKNTYFLWNQLVPPSQNSILPKYKLQIMGDANPLPLWKKSAKRFLKGSLYPSMNAFIFYYKM